MKLTFGDRALAQKVNKRRVHTSRGGDGARGDHGEVGGSVGGGCWSLKAKLRVL